MRRNVLVPALGLAAALGLATAAAHAEETDPQFITLDYEGTILELFSFDTGWVPGGGSDINVRFAISVDANVETEVSGFHHISWPEAFDFHMIGIPGTGEIDLLYGLEMEFQVDYDLGILGSGTYDVPIMDLIPTALTQIRASGEFTPFLLDGHPDDPYLFTGYMDDIELYDGAYGLAPGVTLEFAIVLRPNINCTVTGEEIGVYEDAVITQEWDSAHVDWDSSGMIVLPIDFKATLDCNFDLTLVPIVSICIGTCFDLEPFDIDIPIQDDEELIVYGPENVTYEFPVLEVDTSALDFGEVYIGEEAYIDLPVSNTGEHYLEVRLGVEPFTAPFNYFPPEGVIVPAMSDRVVRLFFFPETVGLHTADLVVNSDAPASPVLTIPMQGTGIHEPEPEPEAEDAYTDVEDEDFSVNNTSSCGCDVVGAGPASLPGAALALALLALVGLRRR